MAIETIIASLAEGYKQLQPDSFQTSSEITRGRITKGKVGKELRTSKELRNRFFWTANLGLCRNNGEELQYGTGGRQTFNAIAGADIDEFCKQLIDNGNYLLTGGQAQSLDEVDIVWVNPDDLGLQGNEREWQYFEINPPYPNNLNQAQRALAEKVYGQEDFAENMQMLAEAGKTPKIYVLNPRYVRENTKKGETICRAYWLGSLDVGSNCYANGRSVNNDGGLRGVRREKAREADALQKLVTLPEDRLHAVLAQYVGPTDLGQVKETLAEHYR